MPENDKKAHKRLADFILGSIEPILGEWDSFARSIWPRLELEQAPVDPLELRDHAESILRSAAEDMQSAQSCVQQSGKSKGQGTGGRSSDALDQASHVHAVDRVQSGFGLALVVAEYRALRASVIQLWRKSDPSPDLRDLEDLVRFNETIDQSLAEAVDSYLRLVGDEREKLLAHERAARIEADSANRAKDLFLATLSHELRTPINAIAGWTHILRRPDRKDATLAEGLAVIDRSVKAQVRLIDDLLDVSRIVSGTLRLDTRPCDLADVVSAGVDAVRTAADARNITLDVQLGPPNCIAIGDASRLQQVVWNLLSNAVKFTSTGGRIVVKLAREQSSFSIQVSDSGTGISAEILPHVFDRFRQADSSARRESGGLGLGLSIVKHIVEQHEGTVEAFSAGKGFGSTFTVRLPVSPVRMAREGQDSAEQSATSNTLGYGLVRLNGLRVLVVDDEPDARRLLVEVLEEAGALVVAAGDVAEALDVLRKDTPEVLVSDLGMPQQDGFDLIREVRELGHHPIELPAVALSAYARSQDERKALLAGFQVHLSKPADPHKLTTVIAVLAGRRL